MANVVVAWLLIELAAVAIAYLDNPGGLDQRVLLGKVSTARFYCRNILPYAVTTAEIVRTGDVAGLAGDGDAF